MTKDIKICLGVDVDAVAGWLGSYGGADSPNDIQRGVFAGEVGMPRLLKLFKSRGITSTWFIPGHSIETFPDQTRQVVESGHEIGCPRLLARKSDCDEPRSGGGRASPLCGASDKDIREASARLCSTVVGDVRAHGRAAASVRVQV